MVEAKHPEPSAATKRQQLRRLLARLEVPDCLCPSVPLCRSNDGDGCADWNCPTCVNEEEDTPDGCDDLKYVGACDHPPREQCKCPAYRPICAHVLGADHGLTHEEWSELLVAAYPHVYDPDDPPALQHTAHRAPPPPPEPHLANTQEGRVAAFENRHDDGYSLWHPKDPKSTSFDRLLRLVTDTDNFRYHKDAGMTTHREAVATWKKRRAA